MRNPVFFADDCQVTVVPVLMQKREFRFAFGILGVADAEYDVRFTSTLQGTLGEPQVLLSLH